MSFDDTNMSLFHTTIRNVGLYTSLSLGFMAIARAWSSKNRNIVLGFRLIAIIFAAMALKICHVATQIPTNQSLKSVSYVAGISISCYLILVVAMLIMKI